MSKQPEVADWIIAAHKSGEWLDTRGAGKRRVICVDRPDDTYPVVTVDANGMIDVHRIDGTLNGAEHPSKYDLMPPSREWEVCVIQHSCGEIAIVRMADAPRFIEVGSKIIARATAREGDGNV